MSDLNTYLFQMNVDLGISCLGKDLEETIIDKINDRMKKLRKEIYHKRKPKRYIDKSKKEKARNKERKDKIFNFKIETDEIEIKKSPILPIIESMEENKPSKFNCQCIGPIECSHFKKDYGSVILSTKRHESEYNYGKIDICTDYIVILSFHKTNGFQVIVCVYNYEFDGRTVMFSIDGLNTKWWCDKILISKEFKYYLDSNPLNEFIDNCISNSWNTTLIAPPIEIYRIKKTIDAIRCIIAIKKFRSTILSKVPKDVLFCIIIRKIWLSREDEIWESKNHYATMWKGLLFDKVNRYEDYSDESYKDEEEDEEDEEENNDYDGHDLYLLDNYVRDHKDMTIFI